MKGMPHWPIPYTGGLPKYFRLDKLRAFLGRLGSPELHIPPVIHVAGTNGKGSVIAYLKAIFENSGYTIHRYISPALIRFSERIMISGHEISQRLLEQYSEECRLAESSMSNDNDESEVVSFFEGSTAIAFLAFSRHPADVLLLETGMGGKYDATNVIENTICSIITSISYDHTEHLGNDLISIAKEKIGIARKGVLCIIGWQQKEVMDVLITECINMGVIYSAYGTDWTLERTDDGMIVSIFRDNPFERYAKLNKKEYICDFINDEHMEECIREGCGVTIALPITNPSLIGPHQYMNAAIAIVASFYLSHFKYHNICIDSINYGISHATWPARMQLIQHGVISEMIPDGCEFWLDGAHNPGGAEVAIATMLDMYPKKMIYLINGRTKNRDIKGFLQYFLDNIEMICCISVQCEPKAEAAEVIHAEASEMGFRSVACESLYEAVRVCIKDADGRKFRILTCGSLYLAGDVLEANYGTESGRE